MSVRQNCEENYCFYKIYNQFSFDKTVKNIYSRHAEPSKVQKVKEIQIKTDSTLHPL